MNYYSLNNKNTKVSFQEAVIQGLAPDRGLYFPEKIAPLSQSFFDTIENLSNQDHFTNKTPLPKQNVTS